MKINKKNQRVWLVFFLFKSVWILVQSFVFGLLQEASENEEEDREEEEEENTDYLTDSNKENETDEENNVRLDTLLFI